MFHFYFLITGFLIIVSLAQNYRLPTYYQPSDYVISLDVPQNVFKTEKASAYTGTVTIKFKVLSENVSKVMLHANADHLTLTSIILSYGSTTDNITSWSVDRTTEILTVPLENSLSMNENYMMTINFDGLLSINDMSGFYKSSYTDKSNITYYVATTQMQPTSARKAFPCFDEPSFKATFSISLTYPTGMSALSNTPAKNTKENADNTTTTDFETTPKMSVYLIAFIVSSYSCSNGDPIEGTLPYQVCSRSETSSTRSWALKITPSVIERLNSHLGIKYSDNMAKLDQVAISDFSAGAMENWGLITYREAKLLFDADEGSNENKQYSVIYIVHELAHQWFGNLVTCKWWSELFLNEGLAEYFEHIIMQEIFPEYEMDKQFIILYLYVAMLSDASNAEALRSNVNSPTEIETKFSDITYEKGTSVFRMVENILGTAAWETGLKTYLKKYAHSNVEPDDLWAVLNANTIDANLPVANLSTVMANWVNYPGYPVVQVNKKNNRLEISQKQFFYNQKSSSDVKWYVPITFMTSQNIHTFNHTAPIVWLTPTADIEAVLQGNLSWIVINTQQTGYYRVNYDTALWTGLSIALQQNNFSGIPEINRAQIVNDAFNLARANHITHSQAFNITQFLTNETSYVVWYVAFKEFDHLLTLIGENSTLGKAICGHIVALSSLLIESVPLTNLNESNHIYTLKQAQAQSWACKLGDLTCISTASQLFELYKDTSVRPDRNIRSVVYNYGIMHSKAVFNDWEFLWQSFRRTSLATEQINILNALGCSSNEDILNAYLRKTLTDDSGIRSQDYVSVFSAVYSCSPTGINVALSFFIDNFKVILTKYTSLNAVDKIIKGIAEQITTDVQIQKLENFIKSGIVNETYIDMANGALSIAKDNYNMVDTYKRNLYSYFGISPETQPPKVSSACRPYVELYLLVLRLLINTF